MTKVVAVTGGLGFIGNYVVEQLLDAGHYVYLIDVESYAANPGLLDSEPWSHALDRGSLKYVKADICELPHLPDVDVVLNLAAETHVDNAIRDSESFVRTNVLGVQQLLELIRAKRAYQMPRFIQVSTDEVYGEVLEGSSTEGARLNPSNPYAASKAAADLLIQSYARTYGLSYNLIRPSNCYGLRQYPEKLIPKTVRYLTLGKPMPVHAGGHPERSWLWVEDCARAILMVLDKGIPGATYNIGGNTAATVREVVDHIAWHLEGPAGWRDEEWQRAGVDLRYHVSDAPLRALGWVPRGDLWKDLPGIVEAEKAVFRW